MGKWGYNPTSTYKLPAHPFFQPHRVEAVPPPGCLKRLRKGIRFLRRVGSELTFEILRPWGWWVAGSLKGNGGLKRPQPTKKTPGCGCMNYVMTMGCETLL